MQRFRSFAIGRHWWRRRTPLRHIFGYGAFSSHSTSTAPPPPPSSTPLLDKVLIANRGEIACRVIRTCRQLGIPTVAIYSSADGPAALHAVMADQAVCIGTGPTAAESYLLQDQVLEIASQTGATAIHPGYGFLSENTDFSAATTAAGLAFVGPPSAAIQAMGSKSESKAIMEAAGVPTTPGYYEKTTSLAAEGNNQDPEKLRHEAALIGFPVLIKAVMGGGGKGMRLVWKESDFADALSACQHESRAAFGNASVLLEKYLVRPRHVEVQIMADTHGRVVHLYERDCSLQRRHQKIIEEAPASDLHPALRERLGEMGKRAAQAVGYVNAGTVEFLLDTTTTAAAEEEAFYFCEMNTRLQVEHPVTEMITGMDLVEWQLRVAAGQKLPQQDEISCQGHAFEARIYAENPARNFLPATGNLWHHNPPVPAINAVSPTGVRVDTGLQAGQDVSVYYDPMISKLIVHDQDRERALAKLVRALKGYQIAGVPTNIDFLIKCAQHPTFGRAGAINTGFLEDFADDVHMEETTMPSPLAQTVGAYAVLLYIENRIGVDGDAPIGPWSSRSGSWRMGGELGRARQTLRIEGSEQAISCVSNRNGSFDVHVDSDDGSPTMYHVSGTLSNDGEMEVVVNKTQRIILTTVLRVENETIQVRMWPQNQPEEYAWELNVEHPLIPKRTEGIAAGVGGEGVVKSPMPGRIRRVLFEKGDHVKAGQTILVMEAMKMEHALQAPRDGVLADIRCEVDDVVQDGAVLLVVDGGDDDSVEASD